MASTKNLGIPKINGSDLISPTPINDAFDLLDKLGVDYITESGKSGEWWYRKWNSGRAECGIDAKSFGDVDHKGAWGGMYASSDMTFGAYPIQFSSRPFAVIAFLNTTDGSHASYVAQSSSNSTTVSPKFRLVDPNPRTAPGATFGIYVNGRYK
nr:MAG TPA_asm: hypothetical protein [Caudoviricetes sp.]